MPVNPAKLKDEGVGSARDPLLVVIGERVKALRARKGMPRRALSAAAGVSERHLANLETGVGNVSVLLLDQVAKALGRPIAELLGDETTDSPEWLLIRELLQGRGEADLRRARATLAELFETEPPLHQRTDRIALIGLRGAGKSSLGRRLAEALDRPFIELGTEITRIAGCTPAEIQDLYGPTAYRRYEGMALKEILQTRETFVLATPGGIVSDPGSFGLLLTQCFTVWLQASPKEHMERVLAQGDLRPMAGNRAAMEDLKSILESRTPFYAKADVTFNTSGLAFEDALNDLKAKVGRPITAKA
ncbi:MAG TPA: helix-turn-helix transcriptional regulator [Caulobacteraceae bacterium]|jgi:XRE family aerobic/anaerobic benzoate catabolism transcriptional regulator